MRYAPNKHKESEMITEINIVYSIADDGEYRSKWGVHLENIYNNSLLKGAMH
jgi:hypothetical protein